MAIELVWPDAKLEGEMMRDALNSFRFPACSRDVAKHVKALLSRVRELEAERLAEHPVDDQERISEVWISTVIDWYGFVRGSGSKRDHLRDICRDCPKMRKGTFRRLCADLSIHLNEGAK